eukprot:2674192-Prorocentrum_lima.AAC.1
MGTEHKGKTFDGKEWGAMVETIRACKERCKRGRGMYGEDDTQDPSDRKFGNTSKYAQTHQSPRRDVSLADRYGD